MLERGALSKFDVDGGGDGGAYGFDDGGLGLVVDVDGIFGGGCTELSKLNVIEPFVVFDFDGVFVGEGGFGGPFDAFGESNFDGCADANVARCGVASDLSCEKDRVLEEWVVGGDASDAADCGAHAELDLVPVGDFDVA